MFNRTVLATTLAAITLSAPIAAAATLSKADKRAVESGQGTHQQNANYVVDAMRDEVSRYALLQGWATNPGDYPIEGYTARIPPERVPALFRNTDAGKLMVENGAISLCLREQECARHLSAIAIQLNQMPRDVLVAAYQQKSQLDVATLQTQIGSNVSRAIAEAASGSGPVHAQETGASEATTVESGKVLDFVMDPYSKQTVRRVVGADGNQKIIQERDQQDVLLADIVAAPGKFLITTPNGERFQATRIKLTYFGFLALTDDSVRSFDGSTATTIQFPADFSPAPVQRRDVYETGFLLLERRGASEGLVAQVQSMGKLFNMNTKKDYALVDLRRGAVHYFNVDSVHKNVQIMSGCVAKKGGLFNECSSMEARESIYEPDGRRNNSHYYWAIDWVRTPQGSYAVSNEGNRVTVTELLSGEERTAFSRAMGVNSIDMEQGPDGRVALQVQLGLKTERIEDIHAAFESLAPRATDAGE